MPKIPTSKQDSGSASGSSNPSGSHPNVLKRNQACHQCRKRKLKCDANRPCSTCVRSHAHAVTHAPVGTVLPDHPDCTYDEVPGIIAAQKPPKNHYEKLESRINELEALLKDQASSSGASNSQQGYSPQVADSQSPLGNYQEPSSSGLVNPTPTVSSPVSPYDSPLAFTPSFHSPGTFATTTDNISPHTRSPLGHTSATPNVVHSPPIQIISGTQIPQDQYNYDVFWPSWPQDLPLPNLLRHLVEVFFAFHPHAGRLFHGPTFMTSLQLPPSHPKFPSVSVLHAICALGSLYTVAVSPTPDPVKDMAPDEIFRNKYKSKYHVDSFGEQQVKLARKAAEEQIWEGKNLLQNTQALLIITWWYWCHARWVEVFMTTAQVLRSALPLGINVSAQFHPISESLRAPSLLPPPEDVVEDEMRRNTFWLAYALERMGGCSNGWAMSLDDQDVSQAMPCKSSNFDLGQSVWSMSGERQHAQMKDILLLHPDDQLDAFGLYVKGAMLLSRVKAFNMRFRSKRHNDDPSFVYGPPYATMWETEPQHDGQDDPRRTPAFVEIDHLATMFRQTFPFALRNPVPDGMVDSHLYSACLTPHLALILLHDPHAHVDAAGCVSAFKILEAARAILDLIYIVRSTSYDITLLDTFCTFCWFMAGRVLVRFWHAAQEAKSEDQVITLRAEVEYIASAIAKFGERVPLARESHSFRGHRMGIVVLTSCADRYYRMLNDIATKTCGEKLFIMD
ncbi:hypothetical protein BV25DRAFT_563442 [Artomyces pyxidatus]|uniref:Uncharacterized protein n=1 Tax=Artomyces pyxidatus TaxID=48021 RepID=A0ACB8TIW2_9AGAM|nr:hypothetical protein BV25DRAFT_563442 [Artomyces pyxidatus]